jgi:predicted ATP-dependent protease
MNDRPSNNNSEKPTIPPELSRKLVQAFAPPGQNAKRVPADTAQAVSELLRQFVVEARARASIEAECDKEGRLSSDEEEEKDNTKAEVRAEHITKTAANLIMDFS